MEKKSERILVKANAEGVSIFLPSENLKREWRSTRQRVPFTPEQFEVIASDPGCISLFQEGYLVVVDGEDMIDEWNKEYTVSEGKIFSEDEIKALITMGNVDSLTEAMKQASEASRASFVEYAMTLDNIDMAMIQVFKDILGVDVTLSVKTNAEAKAKKQPKKK